MSLADTVRKGVALANSITSSLQAEVSHRAWTGKDSFGDPAYATAVTRPALVELKQRKIRTVNGEEVVARAAVTFLHPVPPNGAAGRREPIDPRDEITLPGGFTGPILDTQGLVDPETDRPYLMEVFLG